MNLSFAATSYPATGNDWRGVFIRHMAQGLSSHVGTNLHIFAPPGPRPISSVELASIDDAAWMSTISQQGGLAHLLRKQPWAGVPAAISFSRRLQRALSSRSSFDSHHLNWLQTALALPEGRTPALVTALGSDLSLLRVPGMRQLLNRALRGRPAAICPNAEWMVPILRSTFSPSIQIIPIQFGVENRWFDVARSPSFVTPDWIAVSRVTRGKVGDLFDWCEPLFANAERRLHLIGPMQDGTRIPSWVHYHGAANSRELETHWFPRAAGLITLSCHAEGRPQVMLEAMAAGLPIVASGISAHESLIVERENGFIARSRAQLFESIQHLESPEANFAAGLAARNWAMTHVGDWRKCAGKYLEIHRQLISAET